MSGLVFVRDAQGRPLMPMSAAYARTLVHQGKAHVITHPAVSMVQLTRNVATPTLRPVVVGLALNIMTADIIIVVEQARTLPASFHLVIDLRMPVSPTETSPQWVVHQQRVRRLSRTHVRSDLWRYSSILAAVIAACQQLVPISHLVLLRSHRASALPVARAAWIGRRVQRRAGNIPLTYQDNPTAEHLPVSLMHVLLSSLSHATTHPPNMVVCVTTGRWKTSLKPTDWSARPEPYQHSKLETSHQNEYQGRLGTIRDVGRTITGIIQGLCSLEQCMLRVPTHVDDQGIHWEDISISNPTLLHVWPTMPILMTPLSNARYRPERLP